MNFDTFGLDPRIHAGIKGAGYDTATPIQEKAIPEILEGHDILGLAQTGTGKTAAFMLPILQRMLNGPRRKIRALIVAPTRELAEQIFQTSVDFGKRTGIKSVAMYGGVSKNPQLTALRNGVEIVVACPGRLLDHMSEDSIDLSHVEVLVLDEADRMCDMGFLPDIKRILKAIPQKKQILFFSATMPQETRKLADSILQNAKTVQIGTTAPVATVSHAIYPVHNELKKPLLFAMLEQTATGRVLIFTRTKHRAKGLALLLQKRNYRVAALQGNLSQNRRQDAINGFKSGKYDILVATDIAARGIDVSEITHVINFDMPDTVDAYTHRIGRTGRALKTGDAFTLAMKEDEPTIRGIERVLGTQIEIKRLDGFDYGKFSPEHLFSEQSMGQRAQRSSGGRQSRPDSSVPKSHGNRNHQRRRGQQSSSGQQSSGNQSSRQQSSRRRRSSAAPSR